MSTTHPAVCKTAQPVSEADRIPVMDLGPFLARERGDRPDSAE